VTIGGGRNQISLLHFLPVGTEQAMLNVLEEIQHDW